MDPDYDYETYIKHKLKKPDEHYKSENLKKQRFNKKFMNGFTKRT